MSAPQPPLDDRLAALARDLERLEQRRRAAEPPERSAPPQREPLSPGERRFRRILLSVILGWGGVIFLLMALTNEGWTWVEWIIGPLFILGISLSIYVFYRDLGRAAWKRLRRSGDPAD